MLNPFKKKQPEMQPEIRDVLFGDLPLSQWPSPSSAASEEEPWASFARARDQLEAGHKTEAAQIFQDIAATPDLEPRHTLQAWHFLRDLGIQPAEADAKRVYGVVVEVAMPKGLDVVAAYADHSARYFNFSGAGVVWERPDDSLDQTIDALLQAGQVVVANIGPWEGPRPPAPSGNQVRLSMLTPSGLHFGQGAFEALAGDPLGGPTISLATRLMQELIAKTEKS